MTLLQKGLELVGKDSGKTCITFLQVPLQTDGDSLHWEHFDS